MNLHGKLMLEKHVVAKNGTQMLLCCQHLSKVKRDCYITAMYPTQLFFVRRQQEMHFFVINSLWVVSHGISLCLEPLILSIWTIYLTEVHLLITLYLIFLPFGHFVLKDWELSVWPILLKLQVSFPQFFFFNLTSS